MKKRWLAIITVVLMTVMTASIFALAIDNETTDEPTTTTTSEEPATTTTNEQAEETEDGTTGTDNTGSTDDTQATLTATEEYKFTYKVSPEGGSATFTCDGNTLSSGDTVEAGKTITITLTLDDGYLLQTVATAPTSCTKVSDTEYTFVMPSSEATATIAFQQAFYKGSDGNLYMTLADAARGVPDGGTITPIGDIKYLAKGSETVDLEEKTLTIIFNETLDDVNPTDETTYNSYHFNYSKDDSVQACYIIKNGTLNVKNGIFIDNESSAGDSGHNYCIVADSGSTVNFYRGVYTGKIGTANSDSGTTGKVNIYGGYYSQTDNITYVKAISSDSEAEIEYDTPGVSTTTPNLEVGSYQCGFYYVSQTADHVARIGTKTYETLAKAITASQANDTIELFKNDTIKTSLNENFTVSTDVDKKLTIDIASGVTLTDAAKASTADDSSVGIKVKSGGDLTIVGHENSVYSIEGESIKCIDGISVLNGGTLSVSGLELNFDKDVATNTAHIINCEGTLNISDCSINSRVPSPISDDESCSMYGVLCTGSTNINNFKISVLENDEDHWFNTVNAMSLATVSNIDNTSISIDTTGVEGQATGIDFNNSTEVDNVNINIRSSSRNSRCIVGTSKVNVYGGYYNNVKDGSFAAPFSGNVSAVGGLYTKLVTTTYYPSSEYECIELDPDVVHEGITYTHTIVPKETALLTTAENTTGTKYNTVQDAIDAIEAGDTDIKITLLRDITSLTGLKSDASLAQFGKPSTTSAGKSITFDLAGYSIDVSGTSYPIFIENADVTLVNSSGEACGIYNTQDVIHVGAAGTQSSSGSMSKLTVKDPNHTITIWGKQSENAIKVGWNYNDGTDHYYYGNVKINGGCYHGDITIGYTGGTGSSYYITGGYYTDNKLYTGYSYEEVTKGVNASYIAPYYACIKTPSNDSHYGTYENKVVPDKNRPSFKSYKCVGSHYLQLVYYLNDFLYSDYATLSDDKFKLCITVLKKDGSVISTKNVDITKVSGKSYYMATYDDLYPQYYADSIKAQIVDTEKSVALVSYTTSIAKYCQTKINKGVIEDTNPQSLIDLSQSIVNYGAYAQLYFNHETGNLANSLDGCTVDYKFDEVAADREAGTFKSHYKMVDDTECAAKIIGESLILDSRGRIRYYLYIPDSVDNYTVSYSKSSSYDEGESVSLTPTTLDTNLVIGSNTANYYVDVDDVRFTGFNVPYTVRVQSTSSDNEVKPYVDVTYSVDSYLLQVLDKSSSTDNVKKLMQSMHILNKYARIYCGI